MPDTTTRHAHTILPRRSHITLPHVYSSLCLHDVTHLLLPSTLCRDTRHIWWTLHVLRSSCILRTPYACACPVRYVPGRLRLYPLTCLYLSALLLLKRPRWWAPSLVYAPHYTNVCVAHICRTFLPLPRRPARAFGVSL